ncbi:MAG: hypothetical protein V4494_04760 [Chlamydiota bacterium]
MKRILLVSLLLQSAGFALTIGEKQAELELKGSASESDAFLQSVNENLRRLKTSLEERYAQAKELYQNKASDAEFMALLQDVNALKSEMILLETHFREVSVSEAKKGEEGYALWDQEETTLGQVIMEYGAMEYLYIMPPEMAGIKLHMHSSIPIPRESWDDVLEIILSHNGIGVKKLNSYARQLFVYKQDPSSVQTIVSSVEQLRFVPNHLRVFYVFSPPVEQMRSAFHFFERFSDAKQTFVYQIGSKIALISSRDEIEKLLALYHVIWQEPKGKVSRVIPVTKMGVKEMERILQSFFGEALERARAPFAKIEQEGLTLFALGQGSLVLIGQQDIVDRAEKVIHDTEEQLQDPSEMTVFVYHCRHSDPEELSKILEKVYVTLLSVLPELGRESVEATFTQQGAVPRPPEGYAPAQPLPVAPGPFKPAISTRVEIEKSEAENFIPDPKTGSILMVIRRDTLSKVKDLLRRLDIPKKMVQIEVLLFERRVDNHASAGLNLLKLGKAHNGMRYDGPRVPPKKGLNAPVGRGVLEFIFHGGSSKYFPQFDLAYSFLLTQDDIRFNAAPSLITVNQTPATIRIEEEISVNNGAAPLNVSDGTIVFQNSFTRNEYGITIDITPTIHLPDEENEIGESRGFVTLQTNVTFDTIRPNVDDRPNVDRRHIENEVRVADGQTVILGGLRRKNSQDREEKVPFLGEIPGLGKLFGSTNLIDHNTEMFIFITPKIILDPQEDLDKIRAEELKKRAGDIPEFLKKIIEAREKERQKFFSQSLKLFFGHPYDY